MYKYAKVALSMSLCLLLTSSCSMMQQDMGMEVPTETNSATPHYGENIIEPHKWQKLPENDEEFPQEFSLGNPFNTRQISDNGVEGITVYVKRHSESKDYRPFFDDYSLFFVDDKDKEFKIVPKETVSEREDEIKVMEGSLTGENSVLNYGEEVISSIFIVAEKPENMKYIKIVKNYSGNEDEVMSWKMAIEK